LESWAFYIGNEQIMERTPSLGSLVALATLLELQAGHG
jgi:hypothetical protein